MSLVISRRARREAAARAAAAQQRPDPRIEQIEQLLAGLQAAGNAFVLALSAVGWLWLAAQRDATFDLPVVHPLATTSGATLVVIMLATCLLLAPVVNPFYAPPERRLLHASTTAVFGVLAVTTVAVIAGAAR